MPERAAGSTPNRLGALRRFGVAITTLTVLGHTVLGFEQAWIHPLVAIGSTYMMELIYATLDAKVTRRPALYSGGIVKLIDFLLPAHITGLAIALLLYPGERIGPLIFSCVVAITSKYLLRVGPPDHKKHFLNPSNFGIATTLFLFPSVGIAPPYHFTENIDGVADWILPLIIVGSGTFLNARFTRRLPLIAAWLIGFTVQAAVRSWIFETPFTVAVAPMTGVAFVLFTFYMITDPATTPVPGFRQAVFGSAVAAAYGLLMSAHVVFGLFFSLVIVCCIRGALVSVLSRVPRGVQMGVKPGRAHAPHPEPLYVAAISESNGPATATRTAEREVTLAP